VDVPAVLVRPAKRRQRPLKQALGRGSLDEFLTDFPSVTREQAVSALEQAKEALLANACPPR